MNFSIKVLKSRVEVKRPLMHKKLFKEKNYATLTLLTVNNNTLYIENQNIKVFS